MGNVNNKQSVLNIAKRDLEDCKEDIKMLEVVLKNLNKEKDKEEYEKVTMSLNRVKKHLIKIEESIKKVSQWEDEEVQEEEKEAEEKPLEKEKTVKPIYEPKYGLERCECGGALVRMEQSEFNYCPWCGVKLDWS